MHVYRIVRRRWREARYLGGPVHPIRWTREVLAEDLRVVMATLGGPR
jgi:hypothetical protein